ncbi:hypothetical protein JAAARDRAFT_69203 [Jaapia argillacea MUCL 33604]|uniref:Domain of unknown function at the cortex 1 domain-containing protein n=1 Tax=Jaapia argillacea MUCL 33604 TaxID=933084 RepID=A0A067Q5K5_9AGAM|nr:hypothetical protein JAAARDRAFT_69203 [Jaapia argillacea MUCL 33604]
MGPRLRIMAGSSPSNLEELQVNSDIPHRITSDDFDGQILVYLKKSTGPDGKTLEHEYFEREDRKGITWSIQLQGRFTHPRSADDIMFGNIFERRLKLPKAAPAAIKLMKYMDPTLEQDIMSPTKPWALSPLISTMPYLAYTRINSDTKTKPPPFPSKPKSLVEDTSQLHFAVAPSLGTGATTPVQQSTNGYQSTASMFKDMVKDSMTTAKPKKSIDDIQDSGFEFSSSSDRRAYFSSADNRAKVVLGPDDVITTDFCYSYLEFDPKLSLRIPGGITFDLMRYWDRHPVMFVCCERKRGPPPRQPSNPVEPDENDNSNRHGKGFGEGGGGEEDPWGKVFWCLAIELDKDEEGNAQWADEGEEEGDE